MPYNGPPWLSAEDTQLIADWIAQGARNAQGQPAPVPVGAKVRLGGTMLANAPVVFFGDAITRKVPIRAVHAVAALIFAVLGLLALLGVGT